MSHEDSQPIPELDQPRVIAEGSHGDRDSVDDALRELARRVLDSPHLGGLEELSRQIAESRDPAEIKDLLSSIVIQAIGEGIASHASLVAGNPEGDPAIKALENYDPRLVHDQEE